MLSPKITRRSPPRSHSERGIDGLLLVHDHRPGRAQRPLREVPPPCSRGTPPSLAASVVVAAQDEVIEHVASRPRDLADVLVSAIAGRGDDADAAAADIEAADHVGDRLHRRGVVAVVEDHLERQLVVDVEPARRLEERRVEGAQARRMFSI